MSGSLIDIKKQLEELGLPTSTPGLVGEDRFKELSSRLQNHLSQQESKPLQEDATAHTGSAISRTRQKIENVKRVSQEQASPTNKDIDDMFRFDNEGDPHAMENLVDSLSDDGDDAGDHIPADSKGPAGNAQPKDSPATKDEGGDEDDDDIAADDGDFNGDDDDEQVEAQIKELRSQGKMLEGLGDLDGAEWAYQEALKIDPLSIKTLTLFAVFLHRKRGEMDRAEAFFGRALQQCLPSLYNAVASSSRRRRPQAAVPPAAAVPAPAAVTGAAAPRPAAGTGSKEKNDVTEGGSPQKTPTILGTGEKPSESRAQLPPGLGAMPGIGPGTRVSTNDLISLLLKFAGFLARSQGDVEAATAVYKKAAEISPTNAFVLGSAAHFLASEGGDKKEALELYSRALKADPDHALHALWYAKLLRKSGQLTQAEVMFKVSIQKARAQAPSGNLTVHTVAGADVVPESNKSSVVEASAICNYATFLYKQRKDKLGAIKMFEEGLKKFPAHKGLIKNYLHILKAQLDLKPDPDVFKLLPEKLRKTVPVPKPPSMPPPPQPEPQPHEMK